jgi:hypothetical protein
MQEERTRSWAWASSWDEMEAEKVKKKKSKRAVSLRRVCIVLLDLKRKRNGGYSCVGSELVVVWQGFV